MCCSNVCCNKQPNIFTSYVTIFHPGKDTGILISKAVYLITQSCLLREQRCTIYFEINIIMKRQSSMDRKALSITLPQVSIKWGERMVTVERNLTTVLRSMLLFSSTHWIFKEIHRLPKWFRVLTLKNEIQQLLALFLPWLNVVWLGPIT